MTQSYDIVVIGAGPAGSAAAFWAARHGASVALIDKSEFPRSKLCGGLFTGRSVDTYQRIFGREFDFSHAVTRHEIEFWHSNQKLTTLHDIPPLHLTMRIDLDTTLYRHAIDAGAVDFTGHAIASLTDHQITFRDGQTLQARILIGADGVNSITARHLFGAAFDKKTIGFGLEIEAAPSPQNPESQPLRIDFAATAWGYGWSFPKQGSVTVGVGGLLSKNPNMKRDFAAYLQNLGLDPDPTRFKGHYLPFGDFRKIPGRGHILLAGDAAGLVDPITGEGIAFAMQSGQMAAQAAMDALAQDAPNTALDHYLRALIDIHRSLRIAGWLRRIILAPRWQKAFTKTMHRSGSVSGTVSGTVRLQYMRLLAGQVEYPELAISVLKRLPRYVLTRFRTGFRS